MWLILAFGGSIVPAATGIMLSVVPTGSKNLASGFGQGLYNILGFSLGTLVPGLAQGAAGTHATEQQKMRVGVRIKEEYRKVNSY
jgi:hypothetical protein